MSFFCSNVVIDGLQGRCGGGNWNCCTWINVPKLTSWVQISWLVLPSESSNGRYGGLGGVRFAVWSVAADAGHLCGDFFAQHGCCKWTCFEETQTFSKHCQKKKQKKEETDLFMFDCCYERLNLCVLAGVRFGWGELPSVGDHTRCNCKEAPKFQSN